MLAHVGLLWPLAALALAALLAGCAGPGRGGGAPAAPSAAPPAEPDGYLPPNPPLPRERLDPYPDLRTALEPVCSEPPAPARECPEGMAFIERCGGFCIDRYEAYDAGGGRAGSAPGKRPWVGVDQAGARAACEAAGKRLCKDFEWMASCDLDGHKYFLTEEEDGERYSCNVFDKCAGRECETGYNAMCRTGKGAYDMIGNVWEWTDAAVPSGEGSWSHRYWFTWGMVPGDEDARMRSALNEAMGAAWAAGAEAERNDTDRVLRLSSGQDWAEVRLLPGEQGGKLQFSDGRSEDLVVRVEGGEARVFFDASGYVGELLGSTRERYGDDYLWMAKARKGNPFLRGGGWFDCDPHPAKQGCFYLYLSASPSYVNSHIGFRCCAG